MPHKRLQGYFPRYFPKFHHESGIRVLIRVEFVSMGCWFASDRVGAERFSTTEWMLPGGTGYDGQSCRSAQQRVEIVRESRKILQQLTQRQREAGRAGELALRASPLVCLTCPVNCFVQFYFNDCARQFRSLAA